MRNEGADKSEKSLREQLYKSRKASEERAHLHDVGERLRKRLAQFFKVDTDSESKKTVYASSGHTDKFNRILVLWLDLQYAFNRVKYADKSNEKTNLVPWNCEDKEVRRLWEEITRPENSAALAEWHYQSASGETEIWAQQAMTECWLRGEKKET